MVETDGASSQDKEGQDGRQGSTGQGSFMALKNVALSDMRTKHYGMLAVYKSQPACQPSTIMAGRTSMLEDHIVRLREELDRERMERSFFQLERDNIRDFWEISKGLLEDAKGELKNLQREREEAEERHRVEITVYKQKLKHVLAEHHNTASMLKMDGKAAGSLVQDQHMEAELGLRREVHDLQGDFREKEHQNQNCIKELKLKHQAELMELVNDYDQRMREMEQKYHKNLLSVTEAEDKRRYVQINELDERMKGTTATIVEDHDRALRDAVEYYSTVQRKLLVDQKALKEELEEVSKQERRVDRELSAAQRQNRRLRESLQKAELQLPELRKQLEDRKQARARMVTSRAQAKVIETELRDLKVEHELLLQAFQEVQQERDELLKRQEEAILDMQQKSGLEEMVLERKLTALTEMVEWRVAQLCTAVSASNVDHAAAGDGANKLKEILESKQLAIDAMHRDLARDCKEYDELLRTCQDRLKTLGVPPHDFPFRSSEQILDEQTL